MKTVHKSVLIWFSAQEMFALVTDIERYPQFLPWCDQASVLDQHEHGMTARVGISIGGIRQGFTTRNSHTCGRQVQMQLVEGPFSRLDGQWNFSPLGEQERACKVEFTLRYDFDSAALAALVGPVFDKIAGSLVDAFVKRANQVYGQA
jgi:ribosome-associated toxin RatA of RatAB toxin-antitoxin module